MRNAIARLFQYDGPFVSVYLDARSDQPQAQQILETRWKSVRADLLANGAPESTLAAIDAEMGKRDHIGGDTLCVIAAGERVVLARHLPEPPARDVGKVGKVPWVGPLLDAAQTMVPHLLVVADRTGARITAITASGQELEEDVRGSSNEDAELVNAGGWSQRRYQNRAIQTWDENAAEVAAEVADLAKSLDARLVAVTGDVHAVRLLQEHLPTETAALVRALESDSADEATRLVATVVAEDTVRLLQEFKEEKGQHDRAADGPAQVIAALQQGKVQTLLVHDEADDDRPAWFGPEPTQIALDEATLRAMGVEAPLRCRLTDVCVRAALGTSADVRVVPGAVVTEGLGAVLRF
jgi:hypothetical protein